MKAQNSLIQQIVANILSENIAQNELWLSFITFHIKILSNSIELNEKLKTYYKQFISTQQKHYMEVKIIEGETLKLDFMLHPKKPEEGKTKIKEEYIDLADGRIIYKKSTGLTFLLGTNHHVAVGLCIDNINQIINFINNLYISFFLDKKYLLGHASAVSYNNKGVAISGFSGMGKSTLALHLMDKGATFISNDRLLIKKDNNRIHALGIPKHPRVNPGTIMNNNQLRQQFFSQQKICELQKLTAQELWQLEEKHDILLDQYFPNQNFLLSSFLDILVILNWNHQSSTPQFIPVNINSCDHILPAFMKKAGLFYKPLEKYNEQLFIEEYKALLSNCQIFEFRGGVNFDTASAFCLEYTKK